MDLHTCKSIFLFIIKYTILQSHILDFVCNLFLNTEERVRESSPENFEISDVKMGQFIKFNNQSENNTKDRRKK